MQHYLTITANQIIYLMKKIIRALFLLAFLNSLHFYSQVKSGEKFIFAGSYNMSGLMTQLAQITLSTNTITTSKNTYLHLSCELATYSKWDKFFKIRDVYESYVDPLTLKPSLYKRNIDEGGFTKKEKYVIKNNRVESTSQKRNKPEIKNKFAINSSTLDVVSLLYKIRTLDFTKMAIGKTSAFTIVFDEKQIPVQIKYMGLETVSAANLGSKSCYKISIDAKTKVLKGTDKNLIWLTADKNKVPALMKFSIPVGTGQLTLTSAAGL